MDAKEVLTCAICREAMTDDETSPKRDCGGDCRRCMADAGDPECRVFMSIYKAALFDAAKEFDKRGLYGSDLLQFWGRKGEVK